MDDGVTEENLKAQAPNPKQEEKADEAESSKQAVWSFLRFGAFALVWDLELAL
jgi:hypothetical protein